MSAFAPSPSFMKQVLPNNYFLYVLSLAMFTSPMARSLPHIQFGCDEGFADLAHVKYPNGKTDLTVQQRTLLRVLTNSSQSTESMKFLDHCRWLVDEVNEGVKKPRRMPPRCMTTRIEKGEIFVFRYRVENKAFFRLVIVTLYTLASTVILSCCTQHRLLP